MHKTGKRHIGMTESEIWKYVIKRPEKRVASNASVATLSACSHFLMRICGTPEPDKRDVRVTIVNSEECA